MAKQVKYAHGGKAKKGIGMKHGGQCRGGGAAKRGKSYSRSG